METIDRQRLMDRIVSGKTIVRDLKGLVILKDPDCFFRLLADEYYKDVYQDLIEKGVPTQEHTLALLTEKSLWGKDKDESIKTLRDNIKQFKKKLPEYEFRSVEKQKVTEAIAVSEAEIKRLHKIKSSMLINTAEYIANIEKYKKLVFLLTFDLDGNRKWDNWGDFLKLPDRYILDFINKAYFDERITSDSIRELARSDPFRSIWLGACKVGNLFDIPLSNMTESQSALVSWSILYDNVFENPSCPSMDVINNDVLMDEWLENESNKRTAEKGGDLAIKNEKINSSGEIFVQVDTVDDANKVHTKNDANAKAILNQRANYGKNNIAAPIKESELPDIQIGLKMKANQMEKSRVTGT